MRGVFQILTQAARIGFATAWLAGPVGAQSIRGQVLDAATSSPLASALIEVRSDSGEVLIRRTTDRGGRYFIVLPRAGRYHVSIAAIGYVRRRAQAVDVAAETMILADARLEATSVQLAEVVTRAGGGACRLTPDASARLARVLDAGAEALQVMQATLASGTLRVGAEVIDRTVMLTRRDSLIEDDTLRLEHLSWPLHAVSATVLEATGFATETPGPGGSGWEFFGPDAEVLFAPWFLETHCFDATSSRNNDSLIVSFRPKRRVGARVDIAGRLVFDARTLALQRMEFEHQYLPSSMPRGTVGGEVQFATTRDGTWLPVRWSMRAPMGSESLLTAGTPGGRSIQHRINRIIGRHEVLGRVLLDDR